MQKLPRWLTILLVIGLIVLLAGGTVFYFFTYHPDNTFTKNVIIPVMKPVVDKLSGFKKHTEVEGTEADFTLTADELYSSFANDRDEAMQKYNGKVVEVRGTIANVAGSADGNMVILLEVPTDPASNISCQMDPTYNERLKESVASGKTVAIKGVCNGAKKDDLFGSLDIFLNRGVLVEGR